MKKRFKLKLHIKVRIIFIFLLLLSPYLQKNEIISMIIKNLSNNKKNSIEVRPFNELFNITIKRNTILIFEPNKYHHECTPGYTKYFIDLGYNVDILMHILGINSMILLDEIENIRLFTFKNRDQIMKNYKNLAFIIQNYYDYVLLQSTDKNKKSLYIKLNLLNVNNSIFVFHEISWADIYYIKYFAQNRIWTLGNISKGIQVNPHYFGNIKIKGKNKKTRFFITSTAYRNYKNLIESVKKLKKENFNFDLIVTGRSKRFGSKKIPKIIKKNFIFKYKVSYSELYKYIQSSDYIIIPLDPNSENDILYKTTKASGSIQLVYGFLKPAIINENFSEFYQLNDKNSLLYNNHNLYEIMKKSILLNKKDYKTMQNNLQILAKVIYKKSILNIQKVIPKL